MKKFEVIPGNPILQAKYELEKLGEQLGFFPELLEENNEFVTYQLISEQGFMVSSEDHQDFAKKLIAKSRVLNEKNTSIITRPSGAINIKIDVCS